MHLWATSTEVRKKWPNSFMAQREKQFLIREYTRMGNDLFHEYVRL